MNFHSCGQTTKLRFAKLNLHVKFCTWHTASTSILKYFETVGYTTQLFTCLHLVVHCKLCLMYEQVNWTVMKFWRLPLSTKIKIAKYSHNTPNHKTTKFFSRKNFPSYSKYSLCSLLDGFSYLVVEFWVGSCVCGICVLACKRTCQGRSVPLGAKGVFTLQTGFKLV